MKKTEGDTNPKQSSVKVVSVIPRKNRTPLTLMEITIDNKKHVVLTDTLPKCWGQWNEWVMKTGWSNCRNCRFREYCKDYTLRKIIARYEMEKREHEKRRLY